MQKLTVKKIEDEAVISARKAIAVLAQKTRVQKVNKLNWPDFPYAPQVSFRIAHTGTEIWLHYEVNEKFIRAMETETNGDVYKDSTVEFFISFGGTHYYNFEFSCIGTIHLAHGAGRGNRRHVDPAIAEKILVKSSLGKKPFEEKSGDFSWDMFIKIPITCFAYDKIKSFSGLKAKGNFYKCGDETTVPHFVTWNPVETETPDYHRPEFFGELEFE